MTSRLRSPSSEVRPLWALLTLVLLAFVLWGSLVPAEAAAGGRYDKLQHFVAYALLAGSGLGALPRRSMVVVAAVTLVGAVVEVLQAVLPLGRTGSALDLLADAGGVALAWALWSGVRARQGARLPH
jgi:VanZ family protein